jgi:hypothetical protein
MKLIKEYINEKFTKNSDPIEDLGIGITHKFNEFCKKHYINDISYFNFGKNLKGYDALLAKAAQIGEDVDIIEYLLNKKHADPKGSQSLALRWASARGFFSIVKILIEHGALQCDTYPENSLDCAVEAEHLNIVKYLLDKTRIRKSALNLLKQYTLENQIKRNLWIDVYEKALKLYTDNKENK